MGACHKWLCAPKGSAFLYVRKEISQQLDPLVVSWGYESENPTHCQYVDYHEWQGTRDLAAFLSVPAAIQFQKEHDWDIVRQDCHRLAVQTREQLNSFLGRPPVCADVHFHQMFTVELPESTDLPWLKNTLYDQFQIEVPVIDWAERKFLRVSIQAYNDDVDTSRLLRAIREIL